MSVSDTINFDFDGMAPPQGTDPLLNLSVTCKLAFQRNEQVGLGIIQPTLAATRIRWANPAHHSIAARGLEELETRGMVIAYAGVVKALEMTMSPYDHLDNCHLANLDRGDCYMGSLIASDPEAERLGQIVFFVAGLSTDDLEAVYTAIQTDILRDLESLATVQNCHDAMEAEAALPDIHTTPDALKCARQILRRRCGIS